MIKFFAGVIVGILICSLVAVDLYDIDSTSDTEDFDTVDEDFSILSIEQIDERIIENEIFRLINKARREKGIEQLKRSSVLDKLAREYSDRMGNEDFFSHTDPQGKSLQDRLNDKRIFAFTSSEDLYYGIAVDDLAEEVVSSWIESPSHRIPILDTDVPIIWDNIGIGVSCFDNYDQGYPACYVTTEFAGFESVIEDSLQSDYIQFIDLYNPSLGLDFDAIVKIELFATEPINFMIVPNVQQYDRFLGRLSYDSILKQDGITNYNDELIIKPGYGFMIESRGDDLEYKVKLNYNLHN